MCGKNSKTLLSLQASAGSPPRVREKPRAQLRTLRYAQDHPRVCGKNAKVDPAIKQTSGSPPRVREKPEESDLFADNTGITPACAGKTSTVPMSKEGLRDHPRVCGKNLGALRLALVVSGSPPRVREKRLCVGGH